MGKPAAKKQDVLTGVRLFVRKERFLSPKTPFGMTGVSFWGI
jgi:hypothetical protein